MRLPKEYNKILEEWDVLDPETEKELAEKKEEGDEDARLELILRNLRYVFKVARGYSQGNFNTLNSAGIEGLISAVDKFDPGEGVRFISHASWYVKGRILDELRKDRLIRIPDNLLGDFYKARRLEDKYRKEGRDDPLNEALEEAKLSRDDYEHLLRLESLGELDAPVNEEDARTKVEVVDGGDDILDNVEASDMEKTIDAALADYAANYGKRDVTILKEYFGLGGAEKSSLYKLGDSLEITHERVRQLRDRALRRLAEGPYGEALKDYLKV